MSDIVFAVLWTPLYTVAGVMMCRKAGRPWWTFPLPATPAQGFLAGGFGTGLSFAMARYWIPAAIGAGHMVIGFALWWGRRRKRRRTLVLLGAKFRARLAAMTARLRRERKPSRILRPQQVPS